MTDASRLTAALADRYRIERELGAGGMATVYLARDLKHDRPVAIKVLRAELAAVIGAERFLSEIKTTANLQHPHILPLHDSGAADSFLFYVMPFVEGESLRDRLNREKQLPIPDAVRIATEVAAALDYAHRHGVIHRDIKPENILLHDGRALVADFGIALAASKAGSTRMTETGMSLGTPQYMSPEQAMGERDITARSDVYALGCVVYEMLCGEAPFSGPTAQAIVAKVLTEEPRPLVPRRHTIPPNVEAAVLHALEKLPADRFATAAELGKALLDESYRTAVGTAAAVIAGRAGRGRTWVRLVFAGLAGVGLGAIAVTSLRRAAPGPVIRYGLSLPDSQAPLPPWPPLPSPDGLRLAYVGPGPGGAGTQIWIKRRDRYEAEALPGTGDVVNFTWSPDGQWLAFTQVYQLKKISIAGGAAITLTDSASSTPGMAWLDDGTIMFGPVSGTGGLLRVPAAGGKPESMFTDSVTTRTPSPLPGSRGVLYTRCGIACSLEVNLWVLDLRDHSTHQVVSGAAIGWYASPGYLVYVRTDGTVMAVKFDLGALRVQGSAVPVLEGVAVLGRQFPLVALGASGTLVMRQGSGPAFARRYQMVWVDRTGKQSIVDSNWTVRLTEYGSNIGWALSPDGTRLAIGLSTDAGDNIWVKQLPRGPLSRVSYDGAAAFRPRWMPDGRTLMFSSNRAGEGTGGLYRRAANGTGADVLIRRSPTGIFEGVWSPDGKWLLFRTGGIIGVTGGRDIVGIRPGVDSTPVPIVATPFDEAAIALSPDGHWLAYESNETGRVQVFLRPFPRTDSGKWQVSTDGGVAPLWARNGRELFYINGDRNLVAVTVAPGSEPRLGEARRLFHVPEDLYMTPNEHYTPFDVALDGRFMMARQATSGRGALPVVVVDNWFAEFQQKVGH